MNNTYTDALLANNNNKTTDANNTKHRSGVAHGGHDDAAVEGSTTAALGTTRPSVFDVLRVSC